VVIYAASGIFCAAWLGGALLRRGGRERSRALLVMAALAAFTVIVAAWPGFGAKVGGTIAMLPGFLVLILATRDKAAEDKATEDEANADKAAGYEANADKSNADEAAGDKAAGDKANGNKANRGEGNGNKANGNKANRGEGKWLTWQRAVLIGVSGLALVTL